MGSVLVIGTITVVACGDLIAALGGQLLNVFEGFYSDDGSGRRRQSVKPDEQELVVADGGSGRYPFPRS